MPADERAASTDVLATIGSLLGAARSRSKVVKGLMTAWLAEGVVAIKGVGTPPDEHDVVKVELQSLGSLEKEPVKRCSNQSHRHSLKNGARTRS